ncbi:hypothetical protein J3R30DRAFT_652637 [Lentinula aciculospora]|uniref:RING-type domain-containing protein n=1 Tax=Lentinula aciculospora TaxID=153920 RepID=A0A9W9DK39_9AGAR|nr:hypothetical protein J3R30DRAFT_652637 [Lentinula aciculospora]
MLTLLPGSYCDVCAEEFSSQCLPHTIPCGHILCASCCNSIVEKTSPRLSPVCPFCREQFTIDAVRLIRTDFSSSGWNTPRRLPKSLDISSNESAADLWSRREEKLLFPEGGHSRTRDEARRLEDKVAKVAAKRCSVEELNSLHHELEQWLKSASKLDDQSCSLYLSAALLRAILTNHAEASKTAKSLEQNLKLKLEELEKANKNLESELHRQRREYSQKAQECTSLRTEVSRVKALASTLGTIPSPPPSESRTRAMSPPPSATPVSASTLSRYNSLHARSTSMHASRPSTPAYPVRSHTPSLRSQTPGPMRLPTPSPQQLRSQTPAPPVPTRPRRLSLSSPPKMTRSISEEKQEMHERWIPPRNPDDDISSVKPFRSSRAGSVSPRSRLARSPSPSRY